MGSSHLKNLLTTGCKLHTGTYTGDGSTGLAITGVGFRPKFLWIFGKPTIEANTQSYVKLDQDWGEFAIRIISSTTSAASFYWILDRLLSLDEDGFTVDDDGTNQHPNADGTVYTYIALG